jgi:hypothetical protein
MFFVHLAHFAILKSDAGERAMMRKGRARGGQVCMNKDQILNLNIQICVVAFCTCFGVCPSVCLWGIHCSWMSRFGLWLVDCKRTAQAVTAARFHRHHSAESVQSLGHFMMSACGPSTAGGCWMPLPAREPQLAAALRWCCWRLSAFGPMAV